MTIGSALAIVLLIYGGYSFVAYPFFLSPLRKIPRAHWSVPLPYIGSCWILYHRVRTRNNATTYRAHVKYGPVVRLSDNEISVNCFEGGIKTIYAGGWEKHEWYPRQFANFGVTNMFSTTGHTPHAQKKRILANIYSKSYLQSSAQLQMNSQKLLAERYLPLIKGTADSAEAVDIHELNNAFTMDFITAYQFGISQSTNFTQNIDIRKKYLHLYHSRRQWQFVSSEISPMFHTCLRRIGISLFPSSIRKASAWLEAWSTSMCDAADRYLQSSGEVGTYGGNEPLVFKQYKVGLMSLRRKDPTAGVELHPHLDEGMNFTTNVRAGGSSLSDDHTTLLEVYSEMVDQLAAGHETSAIALTYLFYELSKDPRLQSRLHAELVTLQPQMKWPSNGILKLPKTKDLDALPFLEAVVMEVLRLHAPIPGMQPRVTPTTPGGVSLGPSSTSSHYAGLPGNVRVSSMAYALHRIPEIFLKPQAFNPDRWLSSCEEQLVEMQRHFWAFGSGGRMCIGKHLAMQEMKLIAAAVFTNFTTEIAEGGDMGIEEIDAYTTRPKSGKLVIRIMSRQAGLE